MVGPSKILTVSYGTFSCTLEGFDDPFSTMKSIAEYFRDLAADDRYFGAEPPTPDAEMLHRIAEQEVQRRVEARVQDDGVVLRQLEDQPVAADVPPAAPVAAPAPAPQADDFVPQANTPAAADIGVMDAPVDDGSIAAKLSRIRAVVARSRTTEDVEDDFDAPVAFADPYAGSIESAFDDVDPVDEISPIADIDPAPAGDDEKHLVADLSDDASTGPDAGIADVDLTDEAAPTDDRVELGLEEDASLLAEFEDDALGLSEPQPALADTGDITSQIIRLKRSDTAPADPVAHPVTERAMDDEASVEVAEDVAAHEDQLASEDTEAPEAETMDAEEETPLEAAYDFDDAALNDGEYAEDVEDLQALDGADALDLADAESEFASAPEMDDEPTPEPVVEAEEEAEEQVHAAATVAEDGQGADEDNMLAAVAAACNPDEADVDLADQADAELASDIAESFDGSVDTGDADEREEAGEAAFDRILEETNSKLDEDESSRRRSAIAHLKAAVAATKADRSLSDGAAKEQEDAEEQSRYRADLAKVVRPRRPEENKASHERPAPMKESPSPLMLVSAQRVDAGTDGGERKSILPRRVNTATIEQQEDPMAEGASSFADFAKQVGATELPDLLEAAAAYSAFVEGRREFSRPQLMRRVASYEQEAFTREAGLRSFGQLLRQGKIQKLKRGQFTITDDTRFNPEARIAGE